MKVDIEKLRAEHEQQIQRAIESNTMLDMLGDYTLTVSIGGRSYLDKTKKSLNIRPDDVLKPLSIQQVGNILQKFPSTEKIKVRRHNKEDVMLDYKMSTERSYRAEFATLHIWYISGEYDISIRIPIEPNKELNGFFADSTRKVEHSEITTYYIVSRPNREAADVTVPVKVFANGEYVRYVGGSVESVTQWAINNIIEAIKETYEKHEK